MILPFDDGLVNDIKPFDVSKTIGFPTVYVPVIAEIGTLINPLIIKLLLPWLFSIAIPNNPVDFDSLVALDKTHPFWLEDPLVTPVKQ